MELIVVALLIMLAWGVGDFLVGLVAKNGNPFTVNMYVNISSLGLISIVYLFKEYPRIIAPAEIPLILFFSVVVITATTALTLAFKKGNVSIISPVSSTYGILAMILGILLFKETLTGKQILAIIIATTGLIIATINFNELRKLKLKSDIKGLREAIIALIGFALLLTTVAYFTQQGHYITSIFYASIPIALISILIHLMMGGKLGLTNSAISLFSGVILYGGTLVYALSLAQYPSALIAPISALYPAVTILLCVIFLKEKISKVQFAGVGLIILGLSIAAL